MTLLGDWGTLASVDRILVIGAPSSATDELGQWLARRDCAMVVVDDPDRALVLHREDGASVVVVLLPLATLSGADVLRRLRAQDPRGLTLVAGRDASLRGAPDALDAGAFDYLGAVDGDTLTAAVGVALGLRQSDAQLRYLRRKDAAGADWAQITGRSPAMRNVFATVRQVCQRTTRGGSPSVLVVGETGTGKGLIAKALHYNSVRRGQALVDINCAAIPGSLLEAELFGYERGAFTDARTARAGLMETADGGTLFLDEIAAMPVDLQAKLLVAIEEKSLRRLGGNEKRHVDVQVVAATQHDLGARVREGLFREDLYHRLNVIRIALPPLRDRGDDRRALAEGFLGELCGEYGLPAKRLDASALQAIDSYPWPGNVRELRNLMERVVLLHRGDEVHASDLGLGSVAEVGDQAYRWSLPEDGRGTLDALIDGFERQVITQALARSGGNVSQTSRELGVTRQALIYRMRKHGLSAEET